jgi:hypothetical protein
LGDSRYERRCHEPTQGLRIDLRSQVWNVPVAGVDVAAEAHDQPTDLLLCGGDAVALGLSLRGFEFTFGSVRFGKAEADQNTDGCARLDAPTELLQGFGDCGLGGGRH